MRTRARTLIATLAVAAILMLGCSTRSERVEQSQVQPTGSGASGDGQVTLETGKPVCEAGASITVTIRNGLTETVRCSGHCSLYACQRTPEGWICEMKECHAPTTELLPGERDTIRDAGLHLAGATLRYALHYQVGSDAEPHSDYPQVEGL